MKFKKYGSIENHYRLPYVVKMKNSPEYNPDVKWVVEEKIHGANMSLWYDGKEFKMAKRTGWVSGSGAFFRIDRKWAELQRKMEEAYTWYWRFYTSTFKEMIIYGEWFGGSFPGENISGAKKVQKGISYSPDNEFYAFDMKIDDQYVSKDILIDICTSADIFYAESLFEGTLDECLKYGNAFGSTIPEKLGFEFPVTEDNQNICEGIVIKPTIPMFIGESRMIFKSKNEKFAEINGSKHEKREPKEIPAGFLEFMNDVEPYVNDNRLSNVLSKEGISDDDLCPKHIGQIIKPFFDDIVEDYSKDNEFDYEGLDSDTKSLMNKHLSFKIVNVIKERMGMK